MPWQLLTISLILAVSQPDFLRCYPVVNNVYKRKNVRRRKIYGFGIGKSLLEMFCVSSLTS